MNSFRTTLERIDYPFRIDHEHAILMIGSCFTENIGRHLSKRKFNLSSNILGILYNPLSICNSIQRSIHNTAVSNAEIFNNNNRYYHWDFHGELSGDDPESTTSFINKAIQESHNFIKNCDYLFVTLGTSNAFKYLPDNKIVANCHKVSNAQFERIEISVDETITQFCKTIDKLQELNPKTKMIFTVSPVRHSRDGLIANKLSKAKLLIAAHQLSNQYEHVYYFPSYELIMDDLRDYRFYKEDMIHINDVAIDYIWKYFESSFISESTKHLIESIEKINGDMNHKAFYPKSEEHMKFLTKTKEKINQLVLEHPFLNFERELNLIDKQLFKS